ncbi:hypothetical protein [Mesorhizobium onobrychidis]|uniref:hypothetical protein n=1 Tax=Mesorhizobium onobrychidis TaxID=2775404 RepID=UPI003F932AB1
MGETPHMPKKSGLDLRAAGALREARGRPLRSQAGQNLARISVKNRSYVEKLNDIETPLSTLILGHEGLRPAKFLSYLRLGQAFGLAQRYQLGQKPLVAGRSKRFGHAGEPVRYRPAQRLIPVPDYPILGYAALDPALNMRGSGQT